MKLNNRILLGLTYLAVTGIAIAGDTGPYRYKIPSYKGIKDSDKAHIEKKAKDTRELADKILADELNNDITNCVTNIGEGREGYLKETASYITCTSTIGTDQGPYNIRLTVMRKEGNEDPYVWTDPRNCDTISIYRIEGEKEFFIGIDNFLNGRLDSTTNAREYWKVIKEIKRKN
tara:strand:+ start:2535 stop:3059 length:525 start_codon:yes stop_codon:yes gene_type:complete